MSTGTRSECGDEGQAKSLQPDPRVHVDKIGPVVNTVGIALVSLSIMARSYAASSPANQFPWLEVSLGLVTIGVVICGAAMIVGAENGSVRTWTRKNTRGYSVAQLVFIVVGVMGSLNISRPWECWTERAYRICAKYGLDGIEVDELIAMDRRSQVLLYHDALNELSGDAPSEACMYTVVRAKSDQLKRWAYCACGLCGVDATDVDSWIDDARHSTLDRDGQVELYLNTLEDRAEAEPCRPCVDAVLDAANVGR